VLRCDWNRKRVSPAEAYKGLEKLAAFLQGFYHLAICVLGSPVLRAYATN
jgi:hypothetical protein